MNCIRIFICVAGLLFAGDAAAQTIRASIYGNVTDATGSGVPGATVRAVHVATSTELSYTTDDRGNYDFPRLVKFGEYRLEAEAKGFQKLIREGIMVVIDQRARVDLEPEFAEALNSYGALLLPSPAARPFFVRAHRAQPYLPEPLNNLGLLAQSANDLAGARSCFDQALAAGPDFAPAHNNMGRLEAQERKFSTAIPYFEKAVKLDPDYGEAHYNLGRLLQDAGETERALPHLERAVALNPRLPAAHMALGVAYGDLDRIPEAIREFEQVLHLEPGNANAHRNLQTARDLLKK